MTGTQAVDALRARIEASGAWVSPDGRVSAETAAAVLGRSVKTLRSWRAAEDVELPFQRLRGRVTYSLVDVVAYIDAHTVR